MKFTGLVPPTKYPKVRLRRLEAKLRHELMDADERCELASLVARLRRKVATA